jgi:hypothetical protein
MAVGRVSGIQLVAAFDPSDPVTALDGVVYMERAVTRHAKRVLDAQVSQPGNHIVGGA